MRRVAFFLMLFLNAVLLVMAMDSRPPWNSVGAGISSFIFGYYLAKSERYDKLMEEVEKTEV